MENSEIWGHLWGRAEPFLAIFIEKGSFLSKIGSARPQRWPHISEFSILWGHESLHTLFQHYKLRPQSKNLAKWRWKILSYRALKFSVVLFYILGIFTSIVPNCSWKIPCRIRGFWNEVSSGLFMQRLLVVCNNCKIWDDNGHLFWQQHHAMS